MIYFVQWLLDTVSNCIENSSRLSNVGSIAKGLEHYGPVSWSHIIIMICIPTNHDRDR